MEIPSEFATPAAFYDFMSRLGNEMASARYDLDVMERLLPHLAPERLRPAILVAGTNGKGSVAYWLSELFRYSGYRTALFTSPHLMDLRERIQLDGEPVHEDELLEHAGRTAALIGRQAAVLPRPPTYFEWITLIAASYFHHRQPAMHVLEVGMGGRLDAVNSAIPVMSIITSIGLDHCRFLGNTREAIAREKLGVARPEIPLVIGPQDDWMEEARIWLDPWRSQLVKARPVWESEFQAGGPPRRLGLAGRFQHYNAATVITAARTLQAAGWRLPASALEQALSSGGWPGRMETLSTMPLIIADGAHNPAALEEITAEWQARRISPVVVFGVMRDKPYTEMIRLLVPRVRRLVLTRAPGERAAGREEFAPLIDQYQLRYEDDPAKAMEEAVAAAAAGEPVYVLGSLYLAAEIKRLRAVP